MRSSSQESRKGSRIENILTVIQTISRQIVDESEDEEFRRLCNIINLLDKKEFADLEEKLFIFLVRDWNEKTNSCLVTLEFVADLFSYISSIANFNIVQQYLYYFSQPSMPTHVRLVVYPAVLSVANRRFPDRSFSDENNFMVEFEKFLLKFSQDESSSQDTVSKSAASQFVHFWGRGFKFYLQQNSVNFQRKFLTAFLSSRSCIEKVCVIDECRVMMFKCLVRCLIHKPHEETSILVSSLFVIFLRFLKFTQKSWTGMSAYLRKLHSTVSHHPDPIVIEFVSVVINSFLNCVDVPSENLITEFKTSLTPPTDSDTSTSRIQTFQLNGNSKPETHSNSTSTLPSTTDTVQTVQQCENSLELIEKLVKKMKDEKMKLVSESDRQRVQSLVNDLSAFL